MTEVLALLGCLTLSKALVLSESWVLRGSLRTAIGRFELGRGQRLGRLGRRCGSNGLEGGNRGRHGCEAGRFLGCFGRLGGRGNRRGGSPARHHIVLGLAHGRRIARSQTRCTCARGGQTRCARAGHAGTGCARPGRVGPLGDQFGLGIRGAGNVVRRRGGRRREVGRHGNTARRLGVLGVLLGFFLAGLRV